MKRIQTYLAGALALLGILALAGVGYLAFVFPKTVETWADEGRALSIVQQTLANLSNLCKSFGMLVIPMLLVVVIGCVIWAVLASVGNREETANN